MLGYLQTKDNNRISLKSREHHVRGVHSLAVVLSVKKKSTKNSKSKYFLIFGSGTFEVFMYNFVPQICMNDEYCVKKFTTPLSMTLLLQPNSNLERVKKELNTHCDMIPYSCKLVLDTMVPGSTK